MMIRWEELTTKEIGEHVDKLVVWPIGVLESHGNHLPLGTDGFQAEEVVRRLSEVRDVVVLPTLWYGNVSGLSDYPGSICISEETLKALVYEVISGVYSAGFRKMLIVSGHLGGTHMGAIKNGARKFVREHPDMKIAVLSDYEFAYELLGREYPKDDGHGGLIETARIMAIRPDLVRKEEIKGDNLFEMPRFLILPSIKEYYKEGFHGYRTRATKEEGEKINEYVFKRLLEELEKMGL